MLALVAVQRRGDRAARLGRPVRGRHRGGRAQDDPRPRRDAAHPRPGPPPHPARRPIRTSRTSSAVRRDPGRLRRVARGRGADPQRAEAVRAPHRRSCRTCPKSSQLAAANVDDPSALCHLVASTLRLKTEEKQQLLEHGRRRGAAARRCSLILNRELEVARARLEDPDPGAVRDGESQREYFLRQQLKAIQEELGEGDPEQAEVDELREQVDERAPRGGAQGGRPRARAPREAAVGRGRVRRHPHVPGWILACPGTRRPRTTSTSTARAQVLDEDHYDLEKVKERIIEYLAVSKLKERPLGPDPLLRRAARESARRRSASRSRGRSGASSSASRSAASATRPRSAATAARTSAPCPGRSSARSATRRRSTRSS